MKLLNVAMILSILSLSAPAMAIDIGDELILTSKIETTKKGKHLVDNNSVDLRRDVGDFLCTVHLMDRAFVEAASYEAGTSAKFLTTLKSTSLIGAPFIGKFYTRKLFVLKALDASNERKIQFTCFSNGGFDRDQEAAKDITLDEVINIYSDIIVKK
jgi:hypothetical protein